MKKAILTILIVSASLILFNGCDLFGPKTVSPEERLTEFTSNLNSADRLSTYTHIHPEVTTFNQIKADTWWESTPFTTAYRTFSFSMSFTSESGGVKTYSGTMTNANGSVATVIKFREMDAGSGIWYINFISLDGVSIIY